MEVNKKVVHVSVSNQPTTPANQPTTLANQPTKSAPVGQENGVETLAVGWPLARLGAGSGFCDHLGLAVRDALDVARRAMFL